MFDAVQYKIVMRAVMLIDKLPHESKQNTNKNKKHLKNVGPIHHCKPPNVASGTVARRLRIDVHDNDNA